MREIWQSSDSGVRFNTIWGITKLLLVNEFWILKTSNHIISIIEKSVLRLVDARLYLNQYQWQLFHFFKSSTFHFLYLGKYSNLGLSLLFSFTTSPSKISFNDPPCLNVCPIIWALLFSELFHEILSSLILSKSYSFVILSYHLIAVKISSMWRG